LSSLYNNDKTKSLLVDGHCSFGKFKQAVLISFYSYTSRVYVCDVCKQTNDVIRRKETTEINELMSRLYKLSIYFDHFCGTPKIEKINRVTKGERYKITEHSKMPKRTPAITSDT
jgi:hypothetical protein